MHIRLESELAQPEMFLNCPTSKAARQLHHVILRLAAVNAQRVQLHQFTCIVFVGMVFVVGLVIQVNHHRWRVCRSPQEIAEIAESMPAYNFAVIHHFQIPAIAFRHRDIEMVAPELHHHLVELPFAVNLPEQCRLLQLLNHIRPFPAFECICG